jgi:hypothetical protein
VGCAIDGVCDCYGYCDELHEEVRLWENRIENELVFILQEKV